MNARASQRDTPPWFGPKEIPLYWGGCLARASAALPRLCRGSAAALPGSPVAGHARRATERPRNSYDGSALRPSKGGKFKNRSQSLPFWECFGRKPIFRSVKVMDTLGIEPRASCLQSEFNTIAPFAALGETC
jgi:hypothetical protein